MAKKTWKKYTTDNLNFNYAVEIMTGRLEGQDFIMGKDVIVTQKMDKTIEPDGSIKKNGYEYKIEKWFDDLPEPTIDDLLKEAEKQHGKKRV